MGLLRFNMVHSDVSMRYYLDIDGELPNLVMTNSLLLKVAIEMVSLPIRQW